MAMFGKKRSKLEKYLDISTFKTQENRDKDFQEMAVEQKKLVDAAEKRKNAPPKPLEPVPTISTIIYTSDGEPLKIERDLTDEIEHFKRMAEEGKTCNEKPHGKYLGVGQPIVKNVVYSNYNEIKIEVVPEGISGKKWKQIKNKGSK